MKPNDLQVARLCEVCHKKFGYKERALRTQGKIDPMLAVKVLAGFTRDAMILQSAYIQHLEGKRTQRGCARDALLKIIMSEVWDKMTTEETADIFMNWADKRAVELFDAIDEP